MNQPSNLDLERVKSWQESMDNLLNDQEGLELFLEYMKEVGGPQRYYLQFWIAIRGLRSETDGEEVLKYSTVIGKRYVKKGVIALPEQMKRDIINLYDSQLKNRGDNVNGISEETKTVTKEEANKLRNMFNSAYDYVERHHLPSLYLNFIKSEFYFETFNLLHMSRYQSVPTTTEIPSQFATIAKNNQPFSNGFSEDYSEPSRGQVIDSETNTRDDIMTSCDQRLPVTNPPDEAINANRTSKMKNGRSTSQSGEGLDFNNPLAHLEHNTKSANAAFQQAKLEAQSERYKDKNRDSNAKMSDKDREEAAKRGAIPKVCQPKVSTDNTLEGKGSKMRVKFPDNNSYPISIDMRAHHSSTQNQLPSRHFDLPQVPEERELMINKTNRSGWTKMLNEVAGPIDTSSYQAAVNAGRPNPYYMPPSTILPNSVNESEVSSAISSDAQSSLFVPNSRIPISKSELKHVIRHQRRNIIDNQNVGDEMMPLNPKSHHVLTSQLSSRHFDHHSTSHSLHRPYTEDRTQSERGGKTNYMDPSIFAKTLCEKLEKVVIERRKDEEREEQINLVLKKLGAKDSMKANLPIEAAYRNLNVEFTDMTDPQSILDGHLRSLPDWGESPTTERSGSSSPGRGKRSTSNGPVLFEHIGKVRPQPPLQVPNGHSQVMVLPYDQYISLITEFEKLKRKDKQNGKTELEEDKHKDKRRDKHNPKRLL